MTSTVQPPILLIGSPLFARDPRGRLASRIATAFPRHRALVTAAGIHATQRQLLVDSLAKEKAAKGLPPLTAAQAEQVWDEAVDLIVEEDLLLIRPDPSAMPLAFEADEMLQELVDAHAIRFLGLLNEAVRDAIKRRGEWWRIAPLPQTSAEMDGLIRTSRIAIGGREIYYYSRTRGTRYLTCQQYTGLGSLDDEGLRQHLQEISRHCRGVNAHGFPELSFFAAGDGSFKADFCCRDWEALDSASLRGAFRESAERLCAATPPQLRVDDPRNLEWRNSMVAALIGTEHEVGSEEELVGLSPEFFRQIQWLPGGRVEEGELVFDKALEEGGGSARAGGAAGEPFDEKPRKFIYNIVREYGDIEYVNIGRLAVSLSRRRSFLGRRGVYLAVLKQRQSRREVVTVIRMQKQGVREYLEQGYSRLEAMIRSEEYTEYTLDRLLACRQLGMRIPFHVTGKRIAETASDRDGNEFAIWTPYFERDYVRGTVSDKIPPSRFEDPAWAAACARLLGSAAAPNIIVGRCDLSGAPLFDDGDEVLTMDEAGMPAEIVISDITGTFNDCVTALEDFAPAYAAPVARRSSWVSDSAAFREAYLEGFVERFAWIQQEYRHRRRSFDTLFTHRPRSGAVGFSDRWECVLARMDGTDPRALASLIRASLLTG